MDRRSQPAASSAQPVLVEACAPGEWIVSLTAGERPLHVFRLTPWDWLVSEVGRGNEGRGPDLPTAIAAPSAAAASAPGWWAHVAEALRAAGGPSSGD